MACAQSDVSANRPSGIPLERPPQPPGRGEVFQKTHGPAEQSCGHCEGYRRAVVVFCSRSSRGPDLTGSDQAALPIGVITTVGCTELTRTPDGPSSSAITRVS